MKHYEVKMLVATEDKENISSAIDNLKTDNKEIYIVATSIIEQSVFKSDNKRRFALGKEAERK